MGVYPSNRFTLPIRFHPPGFAELASNRAYYPNLEGDNAPGGCFFGGANADPGISPGLVINLYLYFRRATHANG